MDLILFVLSVIGMTLIVVDGSILQWFRNLVKLTAAKIKVPSLGTIVDCYLCSGTWCGFLMGFIWISSNPLKIFACGCAGAFLANAAALVLNWIESATMSNLPDSSENEQS